MLPFVFNADDDGKRVQNEEGNYDPTDHQRQMEDYYKQYEEQRVANSFHNTTGRPDLVAMQARLAETEQAIHRLNEEKKQPPPGFPIMTTPATQPEISIPRSGENKSSRSPSWAREARRSRSRSRDRRGGRSRSRSPSRRRTSRDRRDDRSSRRRRDRSHSRSRSPPSSANGSSHWSSSNRHSRRRRSRSYSRERDRNSRRDDRRSNLSNNDRYSDWNPGVPSNKLAILNMPNDVDNTKITLSLGKCGYLPQDVRTMTKFDKNTKQIRTFAFVEFSNRETAEQWMTDYEGWLTLDDGRTLAVEYAKGDPAAGSGNKGDDWICAHCSMNNFVKRQTCFKCEISKDQSMELEKLGAHMVGMTPCDTLLIRGLPDGINNSLIFDSLGALVCLSSISMIKLSESKRFAYLQMKSADEAKMLLNLTYKSPIRIKDKDVQVSWCRDSMSKLIQQQMTMLTAGPGKNSVATGSLAQGNMTGAEIAAAALSKANAVRQASQQVGQIMTGLPAPAANMIPPNFSVPPPNLSVPPPMQATQPEHQNGVIGMTQTPKGLLPRYLPPNPLTFAHDPNLGYYVDPITKFCYDSATGYYFNNATSQWCNWDLTHHTYFPVETPAVINSADPEEEKMKKNEEGPKTAQDLVKDMAKWAKRQEKDKKKVQISIKGKETKGIELKNVFSNEKQKRIAQTAALFDDDEEEDQEEEVRGRRSEEPSTSSSFSSVPLAPRKSTLQDVRDAMERALYDETKKTCMLCKRAFSDVEVLRKHVEKSDLHRNNLEAKRAEWGRETAAKLQEEEEDASAPDLPKIVYRDRAKERRRQFGIDSTGYAFDVMGGPPGPTSVRHEETIRKVSEEASKRPLDESNIGNRLLKSMGWKEGQGVGKHAQGIVNPIEAERFVQGAGLGAAGSKMRHGAEASHKEKTRQALYSRYHDA
ncbi:RNA-binding protein 5 [Caenorhabditis elegans]|uniref:RNA-binding protein 5 n=1 Tax=Caenorhabditis elegans TaxID=6239 RepID=Q9GYS7_CAEEL|nr:RNA-binding protein 5 [Caenorhabditis elegans]CCD67603.1 RNA-binding protein 5 [Caenorhabditis elegans]|eukprot:NP_491794.1 RNA Binding Motif protein homolog [Caenorhabditis elegans]